MIAFIYKRLNAFEDDAEERFCVNPIKIFCKETQMKRFDRSTIANGIHNITTQLQLMTLQSSTNDLIEIYDIKVGDKLDWCGKQYFIKAIEKTICGYNGNGKRKYTIVL